MEQEVQELVGEEARWHLGERASHALVQVDSLLPCTVHQVVLLSPPLLAWLARTGVVLGRLLRPHRTIGLLQVGRLGGGWLPRVWARRRWWRGAATPCPTSRPGLLFRYHLPLAVNH